MTTYPTSVLSAFSALLLSVLLGHNSAAQAVTFYTADTGTDELIRIDETTGTASAVGFFGFDLSGGAAGDVDMIWDGAELLMTVNLSGGPELWRVDPATAAVLSRNSITEPGQSLRAVEGLARFQGGLVLSYARTGDPEDASPRLADLSPTGEISGSQQFVGEDIDGLTAFDGTLYGVDGVAGSVSELFEIVRSPASIVPLGTAGASLNDLTQFQGNLYGISAPTDSILQLSPLNGSTLDTIDVLPIANGAYVGLAAVPEPSSFMMCLSIVAVGLLLHRAIGLGQSSPL